MGCAVAKEKEGDGQTQERARQRGAKTPAAEAATAETGAGMEEGGAPAQVCGEKAAGGWKQPQQEQQQQQGSK